MLVSVSTSHPLMMTVPLVRSLTTTQGTTYAILSAFSALRSTSSDICCSLPGTAINEVVIVWRKGLYQRPVSSFALSVKMMVTPGFRSAEQISLTVYFYF